MFDRLLAEVMLDLAREQWAPARDRYPAPGALAKVIDPHTVQTPALDLIDAELARLLDTSDGRLIIHMPPQEGKSTRVARDFPVWALTQNPDLRIVTGSYAQSLANRNGRAVRNAVAAHPDLGISIARDNGAASEWTLDGHEGGVLSVGRGAGVTGRPADLLVIDDPIKDRAEADSKTIRDTCWDWWTDALAARLAPGAPACLIMCMTGDTPVLRPDGSETPLRDIRPGDEVATFTDEGEVTTSVVSNWASQGADDILTLSMASGRKVRANARHPFWVIDENGDGSWVRLESLRAGMRVQCLTEPTEGPSAPQTAAGSPRSARACACPTTPAPGTPQVIDLPRRLTRDGERSGSRVVTGSRQRTTPNSSQSRMSGVLSAEGTSPKSPSLPTGQKSSASTTATTPESCEACSATTVTSSLLAATRPASFGGPLSTSVVSTDEIVSVEPAGREEVFDIEVVGTHRFIANGLDVSNTRWHEDDLAGRLATMDHGAPWRVLSIPAQCEDPATDPLGREPGEFMRSARGRTREQWEQRKATAGSRTWSALYQGHPSPAEGGLLMRDWWRHWDALPDLTGAELIQSWDLTFKDAAASDFVVGQVWAKVGVNAYLLDQVRGRWGFTATVDQIMRLSAKWPTAYTKLVEDKANGSAVIDYLTGTLPGLVPVNPQGGKESRAAAVSPMVEAGNVWLPPATVEWVPGLIEEAAGFPNATHDDQVDALTQALARLYIQPANSKLGGHFFNIG